MKISVLLLSLAFMLSSCCTKVSFDKDERFWVDHYQQGDEIIFKSNKGDYDTLIISNKIHTKPDGDCNVLVSQYDHEFARIDYSMKKEDFNLMNGWLVQFAAKPPEKKALPVLRFLNMEFNRSEGPIKPIKRSVHNDMNVDCFLFDKSNCGMNYNQDFGIENFVWCKKYGLTSYENRAGEIWTIEQK